MSSSSSSFILPSGNTSPRRNKSVIVSRLVACRHETGKEMKYSFKLDTASNLKLITIRPVETLTNSTPFSIAYELDGDSLKTVIAPAGSRPTEISDKNNQELIICKRRSP